MESQAREEQSSYYKAQKRVEDLKGFYSNLTAFIIINTGIAVLNLATSPEYLWFFYPLVGWGIGVIFHAMQVFNYMPFLGRDWEERKIQQILNRDKTNKWK
jgi:hypothetical protein